MKIKRMTFAVITIILFSQVFLFASDNSEELKKLYDNKKYFELNIKITNNDFSRVPEILFYKGTVCNKFNQLNQSIDFINQYLIINKENKEALYLKDCYEILADNYIKLYQYNRAAETYQTIFDNFKSTLDSENIADVQNSIKLWKTFSNVPPQSVFVSNDTKLKIIKDRAGLTNIPLTINKDSIDFVFDTGANLSTITKTFAARLGLKIFDDSIKVGTITGLEVYASLGVAPSIKIGNALIENVLFLVFNDNDLAVPQINYQINGIIGFPIIEALGEVTLTQSDSIVIPKIAKKYTIQNLCLDELSPIVRIDYKGEGLSFHFDTGAKSTYLFVTFYKKFEDFVKTNSSTESRHIAGAGGSKELNLYKLKNFDFAISGKEAELNQVTVLTEPLNDSDNYFYGNLGQDVIKSFSRMTISFESMSLIFE